MLQSVPTLSELHVRLKNATKEMVDDIAVVILSSKKNAKTHPLQRI